MSGADEGREAGSHRQVRQARDGHGLARGSDRDADSEDQRADAAPALAPQGSLLAPRAAEARRTATAVPELPAEEGPRGLPRPHQGARPPAMIPKDHRRPFSSDTEGWKFERASARRFADEAH